MMEKRADTDNDMEDVPVDAFLNADAAESAGARPAQKTAGATVQDDETDDLAQSLGIRSFVSLGDLLTDSPARHETQEITETIGFGSPSLIYGLNSNFVADTFDVEQPDFSDLDVFRGSVAEAEPIPVEELETDDVELAEPVVGDSPVVPQESVAARGGQDDDGADDVPVLESIDTRPAFSFSSFGRGNLPVTELLPVDTEAFASAEAIVENADGTFCIAEQLPVASAALDTQLKALIDSVL